MFRKLRNKIVLINMVSTTLVLLIAFSVIYIVAAENAKRRPFPDATMTQRTEQVQQKEQDDFHYRLQEDRKSGLAALLVTLLVTGACVEVVVFLASLYLADQSIRPVKETYNAQKEFIANASHEIKTPLAVIQANLEAADIKNNQWIDNVAAKAEDLAALNTQLLTLAKLDSTHDTAELKPTALNSFTKALLSPVTPQLQSKNIALDFLPHDPNPTIKLNQPAAKQILNILLDNAIKYCHQKITIKISEKSITVINDGTTISKEKQKHIFERFYQADKTKNGVGLGLSIAKQLADRNHWQLTVSSDHNTTAFTLAF